MKALPEVNWIARSEQLHLQVRNLIDGRWIDGRGAEIDKVGPRDGKLLCAFRGSDARDVDVAVASVRRAARDGRWSSVSAQRRKDILLRLAFLVEANRERLALLECLDVGKPITQALTFDIPAVVDILKFNAEAADKLLGKVYSADQSSLSYQLRRPIGVVAGLVGWNFPLVLAATKIAPALASGNCLVLKPSELTSLATARLAELALEAGVPEGVLNVIHGDSTAGEALARHNDVDLLTFTGSTQTGKKLMVAAGESNMKRLVLECGGKAPNIVFEDCPSLQSVAEGVVARAFWNQGQVCTASSRLLVHASIKERLLELIVKESGRMGLGDPLKEDTRLGAVVGQQHLEKIRRFISIGKESAATPIFESQLRPPFAEGFYVPSVIFDDVQPTDRIAQEEIFGPVLSVISFRDEAEAIRIANDTIYGLSAILWTRDIGRAHRVTSNVDAGWLVVNATQRPAGGLPEGSLPVGGHKESGIGIEGGLEGLEAYTSSTVVQLFV